MDMQLLQYRIESKKCDRGKSTAGIEILKHSSKSTYWYPRLGSTDVSVYLSPLPPDTAAAQTHTATQHKS